jgi:hypothetical protein
MAGHRRLCQRLLLPSVEDGGTESQQSVSGPGAGLLVGSQHALDRDDVGCGPEVG